MLGVLDSPLVPVSIITPLKDMTGRKIEIIDHAFQACPALPDMDTCFLVTFTNRFKKTCDLTTEFSNG